MRVSIAALVLSCLVPGVALAQPGTVEGDGTTEAAPPPPPPPAGAPVVVTPPPSGAPIMVAPPAEAPPTVDPGIVEDANAGRSWLAPTALTEPAGTWSFSDYELFLVSLGYAVTDQLSLSATTMLPIVDEMPFWLLVNAKYQLLRQGQVRLALQGALTTVHVDGDSASAGVLGGALTVCIDPECRSYLNGYVGAGFAYEDQSAVPLALSGSFAFAINKHVKLLLEADTGYVAGDGVDVAPNGFLGWYGVRFTSKIIGVDLGFMKPICGGDDCDIGLPMGFPFVSFTYRSLSE